LTKPASHPASRSAAAHAAITASRAPAIVTVAQLSDFDEIVDVRSEGEFAEDHIPGAVNCPVLDNEERVRIGTLYKQVSSFDAKKLGASLVSANISRHLAGRFADRPRTWRPLIYCWRGGGRSAALAHVMAQVGWRAAQLDGGYKTYRRTVIEELAVAPQRLKWQVVCGMTGTGKSRLLHALSAAGAQVLDLEALAAHRGSVLGNLPGRPQPSQKMFDSLLWSELKRFSADRPVFVEAESKKIGALRVPEAIIERMWASPCVVLEAPVPARVALLREEYEHFVTDPSRLSAQLDCLATLHGAEKIAAWMGLARAGSWDRLVEELLVQHYDPAYTRSTLKHYPALPRALRVTLNTPTEAEFATAARACLDSL
jgi:tRNA 2-selenouridine synthase